MSLKICAQCETSFECSSQDSTPCWCADLPAILPLYPNNGCLCSKCLRSRINVEIESFANDVKQGKRENTAIEHSSDKMKEQIDYYMENGFLVFTKWYHLKRGRCCGNGCRHCPY